MEGLREINQECRYFQNHLQIVKAPRLQAYELTEPCPPPEISLTLSPHPIVHRSLLSHRAAVILSVYIYT